MNFHVVSTFISDNLIPVKSGRKCVDGRYQANTEISGMIARPGADFGYVMAMLGYNHEQKLGMAVEDCVRRIYEAVKSMDNSFYMHTDTHENAEIPYSIGCGHAFKPTFAENADRYGLDANDLQKAIEIMKSSSAYEVNMVTLEGEHKEEGVLMINNPEHTVNSQNDGQMYFVYDKKRDDTFMKELVEKLEMDNIVYQDFQRIATMQLSVTLQLLAKDLPIFEVDLSDATNPRAEHLGTV